MPLCCVFIVGVVLKLTVFLFVIYSFIFTNPVATYFVLENETNTPFNLIKKHLHPFVLSAKLCMWVPISLSHNYHHHTTTILQPFFRDHTGELVPEENFWTLWCKGRLTQADTSTIQLGATPSGLTSAHLHHPPFFTGLMPFLPPNQVSTSGSA